MADLKGMDYVYTCCPPLWFNEDKSIKVKMRCVPKPDFDAQVDLEAAYGLEERRVKGREFVAKYVVGIEGLTVDGKELTTLEDVYKHAPMELFSWIYGAVMSQEILTKTEVKN